MEGGLWDARLGDLIDSLASSGKLKGRRGREQAIHTLVHVAFVKLLTGVSPQRSSGTYGASGAGRLEASSRFLQAASSSGVSGFLASSSGLHL